jgi:hypothetical protein
MTQLQITPPDGYDPEIGRWLWALQDVRRRYTLRLVKDLDPRLVDWEGPDGQENAIGSLLYHIALVELGWLYGDLKGLTDLPPAVKPYFPFRRENRTATTSLACWAFRWPSMLPGSIAVVKFSFRNSMGSRPTSGAVCAGRLTSRRSITRSRRGGLCSTSSSTRRDMHSRSVP